MEADTIDLSKADFSGYASKADLKCSDGRTISADAFKHQDKQRVSLVWQHGHGDVENVLGHAILENRGSDHPNGPGLYAYGFFNDTNKGVAAKKMVAHKDISQMSIWAGELIERAKQVFHGTVKEVSLVLAGANKGATIDNVNIAHGDDLTELQDEAVIFSGESFTSFFAHSETSTEEGDESTEDEEDESAEDGEENEDDGSNVQEVYDSLTDEQKEVVHFMVGEAVAAVEEPNNDDVVQADGDKTIQQIYDAMSDEQKNVVHFMIGAAIGENTDDTAQHSDNNESEAHIAADDNSEGDLTHQEGSTMTNVFEKQGREKNKSTFNGPTLSHDDIGTIVKEAQKSGSFKEAFLTNDKVLAHAQEYGIENIDYLFPDAKTITSQPDVISRRTEWVAAVLDGAKHSPFSRVKSLHADLTAEEARAKGYVKGNKKKDEVIKLLRRVTTPTTVYKKQKLDRDDMVDITDLDIVVWLKWEMRFMLEEELARAILIGDGRESDSEDKIDEEKLRPIAWDDDMYSHKVTVPSNTTPDGIIESVLRARKFYKGTGRPTLFTTDDLLTDMILLKDKVGRRLYNTEAELAAALRVDKIVVVEVMEDTPDILGIIVNMTDYVIGADRGGALTMFDDFDIDYNQQKYLIETRISGALNKAKSAVVLRRTSGTTVTPPAPEFDQETNTLTIPTVAGVTYYDVTDVAGVEEVLPPGDVVITQTTDVEARANTGSSLPHNYDNTWTFAYVA